MTIWTCDFDWYYTRAELAEDEQAEGCARCNLSPLAHGDSHHPTACAEYVAPQEDAA